MRSQRISAGIALAGFCFSGLASGATSLGRQYAFGFEYGNLLRNWSFENSGDGWNNENMATTRVLAKSVSISAVSGSYVARFNRTDGTGAVDKVSCDLFPIEPSQQYTLSFYVRTSGNTSGVHPVVTFFTNRNTGSALTPVTGGNYAVNTGWTLASLTFTAPSTSAYAKVSLAQAANGQTGTFYFDDAVLEKGSTASDRTRVQESVSFMDEFNQRIEEQVKVAGGGNNPAGRSYLVQANELDGQKRPIKSYSPYLNSGDPDYDPGFAAKAGVYNNGTNGIGSQGSYPFAKVDYLSEPGDPIGAAYGPATPWGTTPSKSGAYFVGTLTAPDLPNTPDAPPTDTTEEPYLLSWGKDVENRYSCSWTDQSGQLVQTAVKSGSAWIYTRYEYFPDGRIRKVLTPLDVPGNPPAPQEFRKVTNYNSAGQMTSVYTKDRGLRKYWYNRLGNPRFSRHESQAADEYDYTDYDFLERPISTGTQVISGFTQADADQRSTVSSVKSEQVGYLYDNLDAFAFRTGFALSAILPGKTVGVNGQGRLVCDYNLNRGIDLPFVSAQEKFVATFYNYNKYGEVTETYKYIGSVRDPARRIHKATVAYDGRHRLVSTTLQDNQATPVALSTEVFSYDAMDRVIQINGLGGKFLCSYQYYDWGKPKSVVLGGTGASNTGTRIDLAYHSQGWLQSITATSRSTNQIVFQQFLGYEGKAVETATVPPPLQTKMDGSISQQLYKFTEDMNSLGSIRMLNYQYDGLNRLLTADARRNSNSDPMDDYQAMKLSSLQWTDTEDMDTRTTFDAVGRILTNQNGVSAADKATYAYQPDSYRLDHVSGKLGSQSTRDASPAGSFVYDGRGRMIADKSKNLYVNYGWDDLPLELAIDSPGFLLSEFNFYDAYGQRVSRLHTETPNLVPITSLDGITFFVKRPLEKADAMARPTSGIADVNLIANGSRRWTEQYDGSWLVASSAGQTGLSGVSGQIGEITASGTYRYFIKNNQGSTMATVDDQGMYDNGRAMDYLAYGSAKDLKTNGDEPVVPKFTGKELELLTGLYAFGSRWHDPELGMWLSADPAEQYFNPYSYGPGNPVNGTDKDGRLFGLDDLVVAVVGGGLSYVSGGLNNGDWLNPTALYNVYNGASSAVVGYNVAVVTTAATGGCFVCGFAAGSLAGSGMSSLNGMAANAISGGGIGSPNATLGVGPASYTFGDEPGGGFNFATPDKWGSPADVFNSSMTVMSYAGAGASAYGTFGSYTRGSLGLQNPFNSGSQWSLVNGDGKLSLNNFQNQSKLSYQAANMAVKEGYSNLKQATGFDVKIGVPKELPQTLSPRQALHMLNDKYDGDRSLLYGDLKDAQNLLNDVHGGGASILRINSRGYPVVDFGRPIGVFNSQNGASLETNFGIIHFGQKGAHIVPANPVQY